MADLTVSRRDFLKTSAWATALFATTPFWAMDMDEPMPMNYLSPVPADAPIEWTIPADLANVDAAVLALNRLAFGSRPGEVEKVRGQGVDAWIEAQLAPEALDDSKVNAMLQVFPSLTMDWPDLIKNYALPFTAATPSLTDDVTSAVKGFLGLFDGNPDANQMQPAMTTQQMAQTRLQPVLELVQATVLRQVYSERQLYELMVDFWSNHFNIYALKNQCRYLKTWDDREVIRKNALGKFRDLLFASAKSPAMLVFLDNISNVKGVPQENYARELMELHTLGVNGGQTQDDVEAVARAFTGWSVLGQRQAELMLDYADVGGFFFRKNAHDNNTKTILGKTLAAGGGIQDGEAVLDMLASHPSTAQQIATQLVRRFVDDTPPPALVAQAANTFMQTDGDIKAIMNTILHSQEFKASFGKKVKRPLEFIPSALRALAAEPSGADLKKVALKTYAANGGAKRGDQPIATTLRELGQVPFLWQAPNGYPDAAGAWVNSNNLLTRWNFALALTTNKVLEFDVAVPNAASSDTPEALVDSWSDKILHRALPDEDRAKLVDYVRGDTSKTRVENLVALLIASPHFQYR